MAFRVHRTCAEINEWAGANPPTAPAQTAHSCERDSWLGGYPVQSS